jgi:hypothetical protein
MHPSAFSRTARIVVGSAFAVAASWLAAPVARASVMDISAEAGIEKRSLSTTDYANSPFGQLNLELGLVPGLLYIGPYFNYAQLRPLLTTKDNVDVPSTSKFYGYGLRARINIPLDLPITPYGVFGVGGVHTDFPDQTVQICSPSTVVAGQTIPSQCGSEKLPASTANFVELTFAAGLRIDLSDTVRLIAEAAWKPTFGYQNDAWEVAAHNSTTSGSINTPPPGRNGYALTASGGLMISL